MTTLRCVHLNTDFSFGGVTRALGIFDHPEICKHVHSRMIPIRMAVAPAPRLDADVIINHATPNWAALPFLFILRLRNRHSRMVHIEHSYTRAWEAANVPDKGRFRAMLKLAYVNFDTVVAVSEGQADWLIEAGLVPAGKLRVINPWSGSDMLSAMPAPEFAAGQPLRLGAMGRFDTAKGFDTLIRAMTFISPDIVELTIGGFGAGQAELAALAKGMPHVRFAGRVTHAPVFFAQCDAIVVPSRWESFGLVAAEARQAGRPVLVSDVDGLPEQAFGNGLIADCSSPAALAAAIEELATGPLAEMSREARLSMAGAEDARVYAWLTLFTEARRKLARRTVFLPSPALDDTVV